MRACAHRSPHFCVPILPCRRPERQSGSSFSDILALLSASSTWTWISVRSNGLFDGDQVLDEELFSNRGMQL